MDKQNLKLVIVINGRGGVGKDSVCDCVATGYSVLNVSSITPIKEIAAIYGGWNGGKTEKDRRFLSDLKEIFTNYNDLPTRYLLAQVEAFKKDPVQQVMFAHIREPKNIKKFVDLLDGQAITLLIKGRNDDKVYGNSSDDDVEKYPYDYVYINNKPLDKMEEDVLAFFKDLISQEEAKTYPHTFN